MCRISGILNPQLPTAALEGMVKEMCTIMKHGGPDDEGVYTDAAHHLVLGHRRLSLIDLSEGGHQPMTYGEGRYVISFNGEIYNYRELRATLIKEGFSFKTESDTEVILAAFAAWGTASFEKLNGMFAFAIWDKAESKLFLVRDPSGIKPLYYAYGTDGIAFSSEVKAFKPIPYLRHENADWPVYFMAYGFLPEPLTTLRNVYPLPKGTYLCYDAHLNTFSRSTFKTYRFSEVLENREEVTESIRCLLEKSVKRHLIADAPIGIFLSGGIDSAIIALLANESEGNDINTLSIYFDNKQFSEKKYQDILLKQMGCTGNQYLLNEAEFDNNLPRIFAGMDEPSSDGINTWFISKYAKERGLKAVLSGIGADELYGGYPSFNRVNKLSFLEKLPKQFLDAGKFSGLRKLKRLAYLSLEGTAGKYLFLRGQFIPGEIAEHLQMDESEVWKLLRETPRYPPIETLSPQNQISWIETNIYLQNQLLKDADVMGMANGVEIRVPFLDNDFMDLSVRIKSSLKYAGSRNKQLLIDAFKDQLPAPVWNRPKMGFIFPFKEWLLKNEFFRDQADPDGNLFNKFSGGKLHWNQYLNLSILKTRNLAREHSFSYA